MIFKMKKLAFVLLLMIPFCLSFCKIKECELTDGTETYTSVFIETDTLTGFKGQKTLNLFSTYSFKEAIGGNCVLGGKSSCRNKSFGVLNLTNKNIAVRIFISEDAAILNQTPDLVLNCVPNGVTNVSSGIGALARACGSDLTGVIRVSYK
jgi:hypothetical protein